MLDWLNTSRFPCGKAGGFHHCTAAGWGFTKGGEIGNKPAGGKGAPVGKGAGVCGTVGSGCTGFGSDAGTAGVGGFGIG